LDAFRQVLATMIWIATLNQKALSTLPQYNPHQKWDWSKSTWIDRDDEKPTILVANYTQPIIRIWDKTGRYIDSNYRVYNGPLTHTHKYLTNCTNPGEHYISENNHRNGEGQSTATYFSSRLETSNIEHTHPELIYQCWLPPKQNYNATIAKEFAVNMEDWNTSLFGAYTKDGDCWWSYYTNGGIFRDVKPLPFNTVLLNIPNYNMYDMTIQGNGIHNNWGIGFVNNDLVNVPCGAFTWHGYMYLKPGMAGQNVLRNIPFDISNIPNTGHWRTYASDETNWPGKNITHTRFACAAQPDNEEYSVVLAYKDMCLRIHWWYYYEYGGFYGPTSPHSVNNRWAYDSWLTMYTNGNYDISDFHIHFPIVETMPYDNMSWSWYMAVDDNKKILQDKYDSFFPGETDGDIMVLLTKLESSHGDGSEITYIGRPMRFNADDTEYYKRREGTGSRRPIPQNHSTNYPNKQSTNDVGGYHYAWYRNNDIQIPDWEVPEDLSTWEEIPHVMNFGITWGF